MLLRHTEPRALVPRVLRVSLKMEWLRKSQDGTMADLRGLRVLLFMACISRTLFGRHCAPCDGGRTRTCAGSLSSRAGIGSCTCTDAGRARLDAGVLQTKMHVKEGLRILLANGGASMPGRGHVYSLARLQMSRLQLCIVRVFIIFP